MSIRTHHKTHHSGDKNDASGAKSLPVHPGKASVQSPSTAPPAASPPPPPTPPPAVDPPVASPQPPPAAPPPPPLTSGPKPPPPPPPQAKVGGRPHPPNLSNMKKPTVSSNQTDKAVQEEDKPAEDSGPTQTRLRPLFWEKVNAVQNRSMVWHHLKDGSFHVDEDTMVSLFGYVAAQNKKERAKMDANLQPQAKLIQIIDAKKSQNLAILLKALNVTTEQVCEAVKKGTQLPTELISTLLKMAPNQEEELRLRLYNGDLNQLGPSERFLKNLVEIPFAFKRLEALLFMSSLYEDYSATKESFKTLEVACNKLISSRLFLRLLEAVLKTGNRMNDGTYRGGAQAFKLDTLLKLSDVKGTDGKTTLLSFVVQEIIRYEGIKVARSRGLDPDDETPEYLNQLGMEVISKLSDELDEVKKASLIDGETLTSTVSKLGNMLKKTKEFMSEEMNAAEGATEFIEAITRFMEYAEADITWMIEEEKRIMVLVKSTGDYFHGTSAKDEGLRLFAIVRDFLKLLDTTCSEVKAALEIQIRLEAKRKHEESNDEKQEGSTSNDEKHEGSTVPGKKHKQFWQSTRDKLLIMKDTVRIILEALYNTDDEQTPKEEPVKPPPPAYEEPGQEGLRRLRDKLAILAINNQQMEDSDSDEWSSDDEDTKKKRKKAKQSIKDVHDQLLLQAIKKKMDNGDADRWSSDDEDETSVPKETRRQSLSDGGNEPPLKAVESDQINEERSRRLEQVDTSDAGGWGSENGREEDARETSQQTSPGNEDRQTDYAS